MPRLFIAMPLPQPVETGLGRLLGRLRPKSRNVKWVPAENIHLTIKFLGDTDRSLIPRIISAINSVATSYQPFETELDLVGAFPNLQRPRVFWVGSSREMPGLANLARDIDHQLQALKFAKETRPFKAHLTLGRVRQGKQIDELGDFLGSFELAPLSLCLDRLVLFQSTLTPSGAVYVRLHEVSLGQERFGG